MMRILAAAVSLLMLALPARAERPADMLARMRGVPSTNSGPLGSAFPAQYVEAYAFTPRRPCLVLAPTRSCATPPITLAGTQWGSSITCPARGPEPAVTVTTTTVTTTTVTLGGPGVIILAGPTPPPTRDEPIRTLKNVPPRELAPARTP